VGTPGRARQALGGVLVAQLADDLGRRPDEGEAAGGHHLHELGVLGQEAVARMDGVGVRDLRRGDDAVDVQVAAARRRRPDAHGLVRQRHVARVAVGLGIHHHDLAAERATRAQHAQRDLSAVGDQDAAEHRSCWLTPAG
jgi:hypothetical protein